MTLLNESESGLTLLPLLLQGYYKKIQPRDAWVLECKIHPSLSHSEKESGVEIDASAVDQAVAPAPETAVS